MTVLRTLAAALLLLAMAVPASAQTTEPQLLQPCTNTAGATVVSPGTPFEGVVETPVGIANEGSAPAGTYVVDLSGLPVGTRRTTTLTLSFDGPVQDYDLVVDGANPFSVDNPEVVTLSNAAHCKKVVVTTEVFLGLPIDVLNLSVRVA